MIEYQEVIEGNLKAVKDTSDFGGPNMWKLHVRKNNGYYGSVQWMDVRCIQEFFDTKLPVYKEVEKQVNYELE
jgi:hypothetical protein